MKVQCTYSEATWPNYENKFYRCEVKNQEILDNEGVEFIGNHLNSKTNDDVTYILI